MIALLQRVNYARVSIQGRVHAEIGKGILALVGIEKQDDSARAQALLDRILAYRLFADSDGKTNLSLRDVEGELLLVSQFTLAADTRSGLRPSFSSAMPPEQARTLYLQLVEMARGKWGKVCSGEFAADMQVALENDGPVTYMLRTS